MAREEGALSYAAQLSSARCSFIHFPTVSQGQNSRISKNEIHVFFKLSADIAIVFEKIQVLKTSTEVERSMPTI